MKKVALQKKLTITVDERVYDGLHTVIGRRRMSQFIESLVRPHVIGKDLEIAYQQMAQEEAHALEALARLQTAREYTGVLTVFMGTRARTFRVPFQLSPLPFTSALGRVLVPAIRQ